jgi:hypothetical protein
MPEGAHFKRAFGASVVMSAFAAACGSTDGAPPSDPFAETVASSIQGGTADTTHDFAVGVATMSPMGVALCSGVLLAPNLVATARHCVSPLASGQIDCSTSMFTELLRAADIGVTSGPTINQTSAFVSVVGGATGHDGIIVPSDPSVCGNDIALLILSEPIQIPQYVTPAINPPMTDQRVYSTAVTAIGYGVDSPTDTNGTSAGVRRIKSDINLSCIPNDTTFTDCLSDPGWLQIATANEFEGGDGTCEGDSGSGAYDQGDFNKGEWVAFGVLSRGGVSPEGGTCVGSIYTRFDAWSQLLISAAATAAAMGNYSPPSWTGLPAATMCVPNGTACGQDSDCCSVNCISHDGNETAFCTACDSSNACSSGYGCVQGVCVQGAPSVSSVASVDAGSAANAPAHGAGCTIGGDHRGPSGAVGAAFGALAVLVVRRRQRARESVAARIVRRRATPRGGRAS